MASTKYTLFVNDEATDFARSTKATVVAEALATRKGGEKNAIDVRTQAGTVVFALKPVKSRIVTVFTKPYTKTVEVDDAIRALLPAGYDVAYTRPRNDAAVLRSQEAPRSSQYAVTRLSTGEVVGYAPTTREAGAIMKAMANA